MTAPTVDSALGFSVPARNARGRVVRLGPALGEILEAHAYPKPLAQLLAEALTLAALLGSTLKDAGGQLTLQAQTQNGVVELLVADYKAGEMRGYLRHNPERLAMAPADPSLFGLFGQGYLAITFDQATTGERYQGIVPLEGGSLGEAAEHYFVQSEQIPSLVRLAADQKEDGTWIAGGMLLQHLPEGEEGRERLHVRYDHPEWEHMRALGETITAEELADPALELEAIVWRLFHDEDEIRVMEPAMLSKGCRCDPGHIRDVVSKFSADERTDMADEEGVIRVECEFCAKNFPLELTEF
ncbi:Hsp33 family molecular chaperone HslO [Parasphingopyxis marina]|uniref:Hsp33 family molecular chaperone HslO n=1 Tax=Parasphingopyxis marina TaxID=2761622 RepID=A0A842HYK9_9SPHN|nr:Hsp33 family molecular chaperone HslO [Parasphingopyxis marina]MBC2777429.1 Hsp33 family molecular chaperone HslO [Parasphingopyxis marina]